MSAQSLLDALLSFIFPDRCAGCKRPGALFCRACRARLAPYPADSRRPPASLADVYVAFTFQSPLREAVHQLKYRRSRRIAAPLGELLTTHAAARRLHADAVLAIPLHQARLAERGFNQAEALAGEVARGLGLPLLRSGLERTRATEQQAKMADARARAANMRDAFRWQGAPPPRILLLVDDVYTTGATMGACAEALLAAGAAAVYGLALARSRLD